MARLLIGLEIMSNKELRGFNPDVRELGAFLLGKRFRSGVWHRSIRLTLWGNSD